MFSLGGVEGLLGVGELEGVDQKDKKHWLDGRMPETEYGGGAVIGTDKKKGKTVGEGVEVGL